MRENPFNWIRMTGYLVFLIAFGGYFENFLDQSLEYMLALCFTTMVATKIILTVEDLVMDDEKDQ